MSDLANTTVEVNGQSVELDDHGNLVDINAWNTDVAALLAKDEGIELSPDHIEVLDYLRDEYLNNGGNQPMERIILKGMSKRLGRKVSSKDMYDLFPKAPSKQGNRIAGLPFVSIFEAPVTALSVTFARAAGGRAVTTFSAGPQAVSAGRINVAIWPGVCVAASIAAAPSAATSSDESDVRTQCDIGRATPSMSEVSGASCLMW